MVSVCVQLTSGTYWYQQVAATMTSLEARARLMVLKFTAGNAACRQQQAATTLCDKFTGASSGSL
jgi:hypothetical protein